MSETHYIYLHGFASGPNSRKAQFFRRQFQSHGLKLTRLDFNQNNFQQLTFTRQLQQLEQVVDSIPGPITLIGSSFGGLTAAWFAETHAQVTRLVLLAPAFEFLEHWLLQFSDSDRETWKSNRSFPIFHYAKGQEVPLDYTFVEDLQRYDITPLKRSIPTLIFHGIDDQTIPLSASTAYSQTRDWVQLVTLQSDHSLTDVLPQIWRSLSSFLDLPERGWHQGGCHCGAVRFEVKVQSKKAIACNCSICNKKGFLHYIVPTADFTLLQGEDFLTEYRFNTHIAQHLFCKICGIHSFYRPRSHPNSWDINLNCLDDAEHSDFLEEFTLQSFNGQAWEDNIQSLTQADNVAKTDLANESQ